MRCGTAGLFDDAIGLRSIVVALLLLIAASHTLAHAALVKVVFLSDLHYDPVYGTSTAYGPAKCQQSHASVFGLPGCDAPLSLIESAFRDTVTQNATMYFVSGDWLRHSFYLLPSSLASPTFAEVASQIASVVPSSSGSVFAVPNFQGALGNNDFVPDYAFNLSHPTHPLLLNQSHILGNLSLLNSDEVFQFGKCGYYARDVNRTVGTPSNLRVVVLNTVMYSVDLTPPLATTTADPCGQFAFLRATLLDAQARGMRVIIIAHIPPGLNLYDTLVSGMVEGAVSQFWRDDFVGTYRNILASVAATNTVSLQLFGHTHQFSVVADAALGAPGLIIPSVTRVFGNNPSYFVGTFDDETWELVDVRQRYLSSTDEWTETPFSLQSLFDAGGSSVLQSATQLAQGCSALARNATLWKQYELVHAGGVAAGLFPTPPGTTPPSSKGTCNDECKIIVLCSQLHLRWDDLAACVNNGGQPSAVGGRGIDSGDVVAIIFGTLFCVVFVVLLARVVLKRALPRLTKGERNGLVVSYGADDRDGAVREADAV